MATDYANLSPEELYDTAEAAAYLGLQPHTLAIYRSRGTGPEYWKVGHNVRYSVYVLRKWRDARAVAMVPKRRKP